MIRLTDDDGLRVNAPIQETRALRFPSFSYILPQISLFVAPSPALNAAHYASHESRLALWIPPILRLSRAIPSTELED